MDGSDQKLPPAAQTGYDTNLNQPNNNNNISQPNYSGGTQYLGGTSSTMSALSSATIGIQSTVPNTSISTKSGTFQGMGGVSIKAPLGKVVESGQEHTGRWTKEEHEAFLSGLQTYGKEWKKVAACVKTRTVVQTRTHAQKYFQKLQKVLESGGDNSSNTSNLGSGSFKVDTRSSPSSMSAMMKLGVPPSTEKKVRKRTPSAKKKLQDSQLMHSDSATTANALLNMSNDRRPSAILYSATLGTIENQPESSHGFGYPTANETWDNVSTQPLSTGMSIVAPPHDDTLLDEGKFPEPSPAACGKRKLAEIAAAQMLAGVVDSSLKRASVSSTAAAEQDSAIDAAVDGGGDLTPPDPAQTSEKPAANTPPETAGNGVAESDEGISGQGLSLQIVNPDDLNHGSGGSKRRLLNGQASPLTPWDGQLEALVKFSQVTTDPPPFSDTSGGAQEGPTTTEAEVSDKVEAPEEIKSELFPSPLGSARLGLQLAVRNGSVDEVSKICSTLDSASTPSEINERDDAGFHLLHSVAALGLLDKFGPTCQEAVEICKLLIDRGADVTCVDKDGNTPIHWAARAGHSEVLGLLLSKSCPLDVQNNSGETALHWAMRTGDRGSNAVKTLVENGARVNVFNRSFRRPLDVAAEGFASPKEGGDGTAPPTPVNQVDRRSARWNLMQFASQCRTLVIHHQECLEHLAKSDHDWEVPDRVENIISTLTSRTSEACAPGDYAGFKPCEVAVSNDFERATLELLSRIHSAEYLAFVNDLSKELERKRKQHLLAESQYGSFEDNTEQPAVVPFTPMVQRKIMKDESTPKDHSDTAFSAGSLKAARRAAGAVQHAVDCVLVGRNRNAFCIVRPPGHHAGINGLLSDAESCGFCLFNNVAAGAMHALSDEKHRPRCERCAIVDIDAHHGNGTEEIVKKCHDSGRLLFFSVHIYDHDKPKKGSEFNYKFYPGTGAEDDVAHNIINVPIAPLWREKEVVKSISLASNGGATVTEPRQTRQRSKEDASRRIPSLPDLTKYNSEEQPPIVKHNSTGTSASSVASDSSQSSKPRSTLPSESPHYPPHYLMGTGRLAYRRAIQHRLLPALRAFNPDLIILSTGLDAARGDVGNARHYNNGTEAMGLDLDPEDYAWTARKVCEVADICCDGRVVSVLEGGYGRTPPPVPGPPLFGGDDANGTEPVKQKLDKSLFSECAIQHLKGLIDPYYEADEKKKRP